MLFSFASQSEPGERQDKADAATNEDDGSGDPTECAQVLATLAAVVLDRHANGAEDDAETGDDVADPLGSAAEDRGHSTEVLQHIRKVGFLVPNTGDRIFSGRRVRSMRLRPGSRSRPLVPGWQ